MKNKRRLKQAYWKGATDVISCIAISITFAIMFAIWW